MNKTLLILNAATHVRRQLQILQKIRNADPKNRYGLIVKYSLSLMLNIQRNYGELSKEMIADQLKLINSKIELATSQIGISEILPLLSQKR